MNQTAPILVEISPGELFDKITVLEVKLQRISDPRKLRNIRTELAVLEEVRDRSIWDDAELRRLTAELRAVNADLYDVIDEIYRREAAGDEWERFVELARSVYRLNDRRALLKRTLNERLGSRLIEEKGHAIGPEGNTSRQPVANGR